MAHGIWEYFDPEDFACRCKCGFAILDVRLADVLLDLREHFDMPMYNNSPCRCKKHNDNQPGASKTSRHLFGDAADVRIVTVHADRVADYLERMYLDQYGIGRYTGRTHIDTKPGPARRWDKR